MKGGNKKRHTPKLSVPSIEIAVCLCRFTCTKTHAKINLHQICTKGKFSAKEKPRKPLWYRGFLIIAVRL